MTAASNVNRRAWWVRVAPIALLLVGVTWAVVSWRSGQLVVDPTGVTMITLTRPADGETNVLPNTFVSADLNSGHALDPGTLSTRAVRLYRTKDHDLVPAEVNTSAAGDAIVIQPLGMLDPRTNYTFEVTRQLKDRAGMELLPFRMNFTTGGGRADASFPIAFDKVDLPTDATYVTCLAMGPERKLYAGTATGQIIRWTLKPDGTLGEKEIIAAVPSHNAGARLITGICFDPRATKENLILWVSHGQFVVNQRGEMSLEGAADWTGKISRLSGPQLAEYRDVIVNLPRSWRDHLNNQIAFGPDGALYWSQGSHTAMGAPDTKWGHRTERLLSAAILRAQVQKIREPLDVKTDDGGNYDPFVPGAPVTLYATGVRVGFDMLWHSNGKLYTATNGSSAGGNVPGSPEGNPPWRIDQDKAGPYPRRVPGLLAVNETQNDYLLCVEKGGYYGHPNPTRGEYVMAGGNPTDAKDACEVERYAVGTKPDRNFRLPAYDFGKHVSPTGLLEYKGNAFEGSLAGKILVTRFSGGKDIIVLALDNDGKVTQTISGIAGLTDLTDPLDLVEDESSGFVYVALFRGAKLALLRPVNDRKRAESLSHRVFVQEVGK
jgi:glucose/arabinose dehydrogenase